MNDDDRPIQVTRVTVNDTPGACQCTGVTGTRTLHSSDQPGCTTGR